MQKPLGALGIYDYLFAQAEKADAALFSVHTDSFLKAPHIVVPLLSHLASLSAEDNLKFPIQLKRLSDQFRLIRENENCPLRLTRLNAIILIPGPTPRAKDMPTSMVA